MKVINLFGAPSCGKSTTMLGLTYQMKMLGLNVENTPEFFKEMIYEDGRTERFGGQLYILGEQNRRLARLQEKSEFVVTDCPLPLIGYYTSNDYIAGFHNFCNNLNASYDNTNYLIVRKHEFENEKRKHDENESLLIAEQLPQYLDHFGIKYKVMESSEDLVDRILVDLVDENVITKQHLLKSRNPTVRSKAMIP